MDPAQALADLTEISSQIEQAALVDADGRLLASTFGDEGETGERFARAALELLAAADGVRREGERLVQLEAATSTASLFVVREDGQVAAAVTRGDPTSGLIFYDLKTCLRLMREEHAEGRPQAPPRREEAGDEGS